MEPTPQPASPLQVGLLAAIQQYERDFAAATSSPTVATLLNLAENYTRATADHATDAHRRDLAAEVAEELPLAEAGTIRRAAKAVELGMPGIICRARATGMEPNEIARQLGTGGSYVRRILRDNPTLLAEASRARRAEQSATRSVVEQATDGRAWTRDYARKHNSGTRPTNAERLADVAEHRAEQVDTTTD